MNPPPESSDAGGLGALAGSRPSSGNRRVWRQGLIESWVCTHPRERDRAGQYAGRENRFGDPPSHSSFFAPAMSVMSSTLVSTRGFASNGNAKDAFWRS